MRGKSDVQIRIQGLKQVRLRTSLTLAAQGLTPWLSSAVVLKNRPLQNQTARQELITRGIPAYPPPNPN